MNSPRILNRAALVCVALVTGCNGKGGVSTGSGSESSETSSSSGVAESSGQATTGSSGEDAESTASVPTTGDSGETEQFGFGCVELGVGEGVEGDPFLGTHKIVVRLGYEPCLRDFYLFKHPEFRLDGADGPALFEAWKQRLCSEDIPGRIDCEVEGFQQTLKSDEPAAYNLAVTYLTPSPEKINGGKLLWGPGPLPEFAACAEGLQPFVNLQALDSVQGLDENGKTLWQVQSFGNKRTLMKLLGGGCVEVQVEPVGG